MHLHSFFSYEKLVFTVLAPSPRKPVHPLALVTARLGQNTDAIDSHLLRGVWGVKNADSGRIGAGVRQVVLKGVASSDVKVAALHWLPGFLTTHSYALFTARP